VNLKLYINKDNLHHAYLINGDGEVVIPELCSILESGNVLCQSYDIFTIDDARTLKNLQIQKGENKFFIINAKFFTREAEHALLKVFEEPADNVHFFIINSQADLLLDTVKSRMVWIDYKNEDIKNNKEMLNLAKEFLQANRNKRLKMVGQLIDAYKNNENMAVLKSEMVKLLNCLETLLREGIDIKENLFIFNELRKLRCYLNLRGSSIKMIFEHLALFLPSLK